MSCLCKTYVSIAISGRARILYNFCLCNMYIVLASSGRATILYNSYMSCLCKINVPVASSGRGKILDMFCLCKMYVCLNVPLCKCSNVKCTSGSSGQAVILYMPGLTCVTCTSVGLSPVHAGLDLIGIFIIY